jgi:FAD-linked sulfhydryl oxidase
MCILHHSQAHAAAFFRALGALYPCHVCRDDFRENLVRDPPKTHNRAALSKWLCAQHNEVNAKLGKPAFPCDLPALDRRWREAPAGSPCAGDGEL